MRSYSFFGLVQAAILASAWVAAAGPANAQAETLSVRSIAEVESTLMDSGRAAVKLIPADRVVPGDRVLYTLEVRNITSSALEAPTVTHAVPEHMRYLADSAVGPGAEVSYSVDGGLTFGSAASLRVQGSDGRPRAAVAADYTHIRWQLKNSLKANSVAFVRFRALVK